MHIFSFCRSCTFYSTYLEGKSVLSDLQCSKTFWISSQHLIMGFYIIQISGFSWQITRPGNIKYLFPQGKLLVWLPVTQSTTQPISLFYITSSPVGIWVFNLYTRSFMTEIFLWNERRKKTKDESFLKKLFKSLKTKMLISTFLIIWMILIPPQRQI